MPSCRDSDKSASGRLHCTLEFQAIPVPAQVAWWRRAHTRPCPTSWHGFRATSREMVFCCAANHHMLREGMRYRCVYVAGGFWHVLRRRTMGVAPGESRPRARAPWARITDPFPAARLGACRRRQGKDECQAVSWDRKRGRVCLRCIGLVWGGPSDHEG